MLTDRYTNAQQNTLLGGGNNEQCEHTRRQAAEVTVGVVDRDVTRQ